MIVIYGKEACGYCTMSKTLCEQRGVSYEYKNLGTDYTDDEFFKTFPSARTFPQITINEQVIGGFNELREYFENE